MIREKIFAALIALSLGALATSCVMVDSGDQIEVVGPSGNDIATQFPPLGAFLIHRCGSLDCHGEVGRNLRIYGKDGLRLDPQGLTNGSPTSADEYEADYRSVVALEPEIMAEVVHDHGANPERLTFYRKPLGLEFHKGGRLIAKGDVQDKCIRSWLAGAVDTTSCTAALAAP
jgi:hypothetical protein